VLFFSGVRKKTLGGDDLQGLTLQNNTHPERDLKTWYVFGGWDCGWEKFEVGYEIL